MKITKVHVYVAFVIIILGLVLYYGLASQSNIIAKGIILTFVALTGLKLIENRKNIPKYMEKLIKQNKTK